ncbi:MAG: tetratricopeptide repeat protein [Thermosynechococcaceae cyanobacterium MS004]|nr:tetratricopeptide repeat protein [Thermosynechococcaceae cyanobacterium MS004]
MILRFTPLFFDAQSYNRGNTRRALGDKQGAIADYDQAIRLNPKDAEAYNNRGVTRRALGDNQGAIADYEEAIRLAPKDAAAYVNRGNIRSQLEDKQGAIIDLQTAASLYRSQGNESMYRKVLNALQQINRR